MDSFKQKFIDTAYTKFGVKANESINFEQAFAIIDEIEQCNIADVSGSAYCNCGQGTTHRADHTCGSCGKPFC